MKENTRKPKVKTRTVTSKEVSMNLPGKEVEQVLKDYVQKNFAEFRNMPIILTFYINDEDSDDPQGISNVFITAKRIKES